MKKTEYQKWVSLMAKVDNDLKKQEISDRKLALQKENKSHKRTEILPPDTDNFTV